MIKTIRLLPVLILLLSSQAWGEVYYVRTDGHDTNCNGSADVADSAPVRPACAKKTIKVGYDLVSSSTGNTVYVRAGTYAETAQAAIDRAGSAGAYNKLIGGIGGETIYDGTAIASTNVAVTADYNWIEGFTFTGTDGTSARITILVYDTGTPTHTVIKGNKFKNLSNAINYQTGGGNIYNNIFEGSKEVVEGIGSIVLYPNTGFAIISYNIFKASDNNFVFPIYADSTLGATLLNNVFTGSQRAAILLGAAQVLTVSNNIFTAPGEYGASDGYSIANYGVAGNGSTIVGGNNMYLPNGLDGRVTVESSITDNTTGSLYDNPRFTHHSRESYLFMTIDDAGSLNDSLYLAQSYYNPLGLKLINAIQYVTVEQELVSHDNVVAFINAGNDIASHSYSHSQLTSLSALTIDGPASSTMTITTTTTDPDSDNWVGNIELKEGAVSVDNISLSASKTLNTIITRIHNRNYGGGAWSCVEKAGISQTRIYAKGVALAPQVDTEVSSATDISLDPTAFYKVEVTEATSKLQAWIRAGATGNAASYTVKYYVSPGNLTDNTVRDVVGSSGLKGARSDTGVTSAALDSANLSAFHPFNTKFNTTDIIRLNGAGYKGASNVSFTSAGKTIAVVGATLKTTNGLAIGDVITVVNTTSNNKNVTIDNIVEGGGNTTITAIETLADESNSSAILTCEVKFKRNVKAFIAGQNAGGNFRETMNHSLSSLDGFVEVEHQWFAEAAGTYNAAFRHSINDVLDTIWSGTGEDGNTWTEGVGSKSAPDNTLRLDHVYTDISDFRLLSSSPAINAGVDVGLTTDYLGNAIVGLPDIGAYEYQGGTGGCPVFLMNYDQSVACLGGSGTRYDRAKAYFTAAGCSTGTLGDMDRCYTTAQGCATGTYIDRWQCVLGVTGGVPGIMDYIRATYGN